MNLDEIVRRFHNISLNRKYFLCLAKDSEKQALDKLVISLSMEKQSILCDKL